MKIRAADFFCGCGGTSSGMRSAGIEVVMGLDLDASAGKTFQKNFPKARFVHGDVRQISPRSLEPTLSRRRKAPLLFCACAPCQPFSAQNPKALTRIRKTHDAALLDEFHRFVSYFLPEYVFIENVPGMQIISKRTGPFARFLAHLNSLNYYYSIAVVNCHDYGVPQKRQRLVLLASRVGRLDLPAPTHGTGTGLKPFSTVRDWIAKYPALSAGETDYTYLNHRCRSLSPLNLARLQATPAGGTRASWPDALVLDCHKEHNGHTDVYGRLEWDRPAAALTTKCITLSNGRFGHPEQNRAISVREAAALQTFPDTFEFVGNLNSMARQIGNAVPVQMAKVFGQAIVRHHARRVRRKLCG